MIVCDDASTDGTLEQVADIADPRLRLIGNGSNVGLARNWNRAVRLGAGQFIKPLMHDDTLDSDCVEVLVRAMRASPGATFAVCERRVVIEDGDARLAAWSLRHAQPLDRLGLSAGELAGTLVFAAHRRRAFRENLMGEPTSVLMRADCTLLPGPFNSSMEQFVDVELWLRLAARGSVVVVRETKATFRAHGSSATWSHGRPADVLRERYRLLRGLRQDPMSRPLTSRLDWIGVLGWAALAAAKRSIRRRHPTPQ